MKVIAFKFKGDKKITPDEQKPKIETYENLVFKVLFVCFVVLVTAQETLAIPTVRQKLNLNDKSIGTPLQQDEYLYNQGQLTLSIMDGNADPMVKILVNGDEVAFFENSSMAINVKEGDVVELDASSSPIEHLIKITSVTSNIENRCMGAYTEVDSNIKRLVKVTFK